MPGLAAADFARRVRHANAVADGVPRVWADGDLLGVLRDAAAELGSTPSATWYASVYRERGWPSPAVYIQRFGRWSAAMARAGLTPNRGTRIGHSQRYTDADCRRAVADAARECGRPPTVVEYEEYRRESLERLPSVPTLRNRHGGWMRALEVLLDLPEAEGLDRRVRRGRP